MGTRAVALDADLLFKMDSSAPRTVVDRSLVRSHSHVYLAIEHIYSPTNGLHRALIQIHVLNNP
eukprot:7104606-Prymnesium_polylepis.2